MVLSLRRGAGASKLLAASALLVASRSVLWRRRLLLLADNARIEPNLRLNSEAAGGCSVAAATALSSTVERAGSSFQNSISERTRRHASSSNGLTGGAARCGVVLVEAIVVVHER